MQTLIGGGDEHALWRSDDEGKSWSRIIYNENRNFLTVRLHDHVSQRVSFHWWLSFADPPLFSSVLYRTAPPPPCPSPTPTEQLFLVTGDNRLLYSSDMGVTFRYVSIPDGGRATFLSDVLDFHPEEKDWLIWVGGSPSGDRHAVAYVSTDNGDSWKEFDRYVEKCVFAEDIQFTRVEKDSIYCTAYQIKSGDQKGFEHAAATPGGNIMKLFKYDKLGQASKMVLEERVIQFYVFEKFMAVAKVS